MGDKRYSNPVRLKIIGPKREYCPARTGALACDEVSTPNAQALANDDATNSFAPKTAGPMRRSCLVRPKIVGFRRSFRLERASAGLERYFQSVRAKSLAPNEVLNSFAQALACEALFGPLLRKRRCWNMNRTPKPNPTAKLLPQKEMQLH